MEKNVRILDLASDEFSTILDGCFEYEINDDVWHVSGIAHDILDCEADLGLRDGLVDMINEFVESGKMRDCEEFKMSRGSQCWQTFVVKLEKKGNVIRGIMINVSDVGNDDLKERHHMQKMASLGVLTTGIVHDLKNQLACIGANVTFVEHFGDGHALGKYVSNIRRLLGDADEMIVQTLELAAKGESVKKRFDLAPVLEDVVAFFSRVSGGCIDVKTSMDESEHQIVGVPSLVSNAILNLCANAKDAIDGQGTIEVSLIKGKIDEIPNALIGTCEKSREYSVLRIIDNGCGIEDDLIKKIFKPFFSTKKSGFGNAGMGLSGVMETVTMHEGSITIDSEVGKGTEFTIYLPAA